MQGGLSDFCRHGRTDNRLRPPGCFPQPRVPNGGPRVLGGRHGRRGPGPAAGPLIGVGGRRHALPGVQPHAAHRQHAQLPVPRVRPGPLDGGGVVRGRGPGGQRHRAGLLRQGEERERARGGQGVGRRRGGAAVPAGPDGRRAGRGGGGGGRQGDHAEVLCAGDVRRRGALLQGQDRSRSRAVAALSAGLRQNMLRRQQQEATTGYVHVAARLYVSFFL